MATKEKNKLGGLIHPFSASFCWLSVLWNEIVATFLCGLYCVNFKVYTLL